MSLLDTLNVSNSGLNTSQVGMNVVGHNIANANNESYTRQRVDLNQTVPFHTTPGDIGTGVKIAQIVRIHDEFVYTRLKSSSSRLEYDSFSKTNLEEVAKYFPDLQEKGLYNDLKNYFNSWNDLSAHPNDSAQKTALVQNIKTFSTNLKDSRQRVQKLQNSINDQLKTSIDEVNRIGKEIANINKKISHTEITNDNRANDLRDQRDKLESTLQKLLDISVLKGSMKSDSTKDQSITDGGKMYYLNIAGHSFVDGVTFHPLKIDNKDEPNGFYTISHVSQDLSLVDLTGKIKGGKIGAMLDLRGRDIDPKTHSPNDGLLQGYLDDLDSFAKTFIDKTNTIYAKSAKESMHSKEMKYYDDDDKITYLDEIKEGSFDVVVYDNDGNETARRTIQITKDTTMKTGTDSIVEKFNADQDDNEDNDSTNDLDDLFSANYVNNVLTITPKDGISGYTIAIEDNGTNFAATAKTGNLLEGESAKDISLKNEYEENPDKLQAYKAPVEGNNEVANEMVQLQYDNIDFERKNKESVNDTIYGFYSFVTTNIATDAQHADRNKEASTALYNTVYQEFQSISGVNIDEELTNLIKYQTGYTANAKVISTIDKMLDVLLGIKQ